MTDPSADVDGVSLVSEIVLVCEVLSKLTAMTSLPLVSHDEHLPPLPEGLLSDAVTALAACAQRACCEDQDFALPAVQGAQLEHP